MEKNRQMDFEGANKYIIEQISKAELPNHFYHNIEHTLDVYDSALLIAKAENLSEHKTTLLKTACMFHDAGMINTYVGHEAAAVEICKEALPIFDYVPEDINEISEMIMATKLPQSAKTQMEKIICDADLDYLGRDDFFMIAHRLRLEWSRLGFTSTTLKQWYQGQIIFLESHSYYTQSAIKARQEGKDENLRQIKEILHEE
jgi:uncharacterized protein